MPRARPKSPAIATLPLLLALSVPAVAIEQCVPTEPGEVIDTGDGSYTYRLPDGYEEECGEYSRGPGESQQLVAHFPPGSGSGQLLAVRASTAHERIDATEWLAQAVATSPDAPPQVIEIGLRQGTDGLLLATRDATGRIAIAGTPLPRIGGDRTLLSVTLAGDAAQSVLAIGGPGGAAVRWPIAQGASVTVVGAGGTGPEPAVMSLGNLD